MTDSCNRDLASPLLPGVINPLFPFSWLSCTLRYVGVDVLPSYIG